MKLYGNAGSPCTRAVLNLVAERGTNVEFVDIDLSDGAQRSPEHLLRHPFGRVPVLQDGDFNLYESRAILRYVDEALPGARLTPVDPRQRAQMEQWLSVDSSYFYPKAYNYVAQKIFMPMFGMPTDQQVVQDAKDNLSQVFEVMDSHLVGKDYLLGDAFSLADISFSHYFGFVIGANDEDDFLESRPNLKAWWQRVSSRPAFAQLVA